MSWHLRPIDKPRCLRCSKAARVRLFNRFNADLGPYCNACGKREVHERERMDREAERLEAARRDAAKLEPGGG